MNRYRKLPYFLFISSIFFTIPACKNEKTQQRGGEPPVVTVNTPVVKKVIDYKYYTVRKIDPIFFVQIRARVSGYLDSINFLPGKEVKKGDLLFVIDPRPYQAAYDEAKSNVAALDARLIRATNDMKRADQLITTKAISQEDYDRAVAAKLEATAGLQGAQASLEKADLDLKWTRIEAPFDGRISRNLIDVGNLVQANAAESTLLTDIVDSSWIYAYFDMDESTLLELIKERIEEAGKGKVDAKYVEGQENAKLNNNLSDVVVKMRVANEPDFAYSGHLNFIDNQVNSNTGTIPIRAKFENPKKFGDMRSLVAGGHGDICVPTSDEYEAMLVPDDAIQFDQSREVLYVVNDKDMVVSKQVKKGDLYNGLRIIREGIQPTDRIIVNGAIRVRPGITVKPVNAESSDAKKEAATPNNIETPRTPESPKAAETKK